MSQAPYHGQCLCGAIAYEVDTFSSQMAHCHCSMCRKFSGAAFATFGEARSADFRWTRGESQLQSYTASNGTTRRFCPHCGSSLTFSPANDDGSVIEVALGTLDSPIEQQADAHIFVANRASWHAIEDGLPRYTQGRDGPKSTD